MYIFVLCFIVVPFPPGKTPFVAQLDNHNNDDNRVEMGVTFRCIVSLFFFFQETVVVQKESDPHQNHLSVHEKRTLFQVLDTLQHVTKACMHWCQRVESSNNTSDEATDCNLSSPLHGVSHQPVRGLPRCILQAKGKGTEMGLLLTESKLQLQDVRDMHRIKKAAVLQQLHELASQTENIVLFPKLLK
jgi:hypothetical protein